MTRASRGPVRPYDERLREIADSVGLRPVDLMILACVFTASPEPLDVPAVARELRDNIYPMGVMLADLARDGLVLRRRLTTDHGPTYTISDAGMITIRQALGAY